MPPLSSTAYEDQILINCLSFQIPDQRSASIQRCKTNVLLLRALPKEHHFIACSAHKTKAKTIQQHTKTVNISISINKEYSSIMSVYTATVTKHNAAQPIGIGLKDLKNGIFISSIHADSPLTGSSLKIGMNLLSINGIPMTNLTATDAIKIIKETEGKLVLTADNFVPAQITFKMGLLNAEGKRNGTMVERDINKATPTMFKEAGVPSETFRRVYKLVESELLPIAYENYKHTTAYNVKIEDYVGSQMVKGGLIGFGQESKEEKKVFQMVKQATVLQSSVDMKAAQVKDIKQTPCLQNTT